jgi:hypothetical protein
MQKKDRKTERKKERQKDIETPHFYPKKLIRI